MIIDIIIWIAGVLFVFWAAFFQEPEDISADEDETEAASSSQAILRIREP